MTGETKKQKIVKNYTITFRSLRAAAGSSPYVVTIGGGTEGTVALKGGAEPFTTQEDDSDDIYQPVRTQSGYVRIVDDGYAADGVTVFDWKDLIPETDTSRPVTLSRGGTVLWQGFMQAQDFGQTLYGNPQEREFPVQCALSVTEGTDINHTQKELRNFAYLLQQVLLSIPDACRPTRVMVQGGADARTMLLKQIDWQNFAEDDGNGYLSARFTMMQCLEDMCRYWGWTARTDGQTLWLVRGASALIGYLSLSLSDLASLADGSSGAGSVVSAPSVREISGDVFASVDQRELLLRGVQKATVKADGNGGDGELVMCYPHSVLKIMKSGGDYTEEWHGEGGVTIDHTVTYTDDVTNFTAALLKGSCGSGGSFNLMTVNDGKDGDAQAVVRLRSNYAAGVALASFETVYEHSLCDGVVEIRGTVYKYGNRFDNSGARADKQQHMWMRVGIGKDRQHAVWASRGLGGRATWGSTMTSFQSTIGSGDDLLALLELPDEASGLLFVDLLGSDDFCPWDIWLGWTDHTFELADFSVKVARSSRYLDLTTGFLGKYQTKELSDTRIYESSNGNKNRSEWEADCIFASDNDMEFGYGVLLDEDGSPMKGISTGGIAGVLLRPEQMLADRVATYWSTAKTRLDVEMRYDVVGAVGPDEILRIGGVTGYVIAVGHDWRDDVIRVTTLEW